MKFFLKRQSPPRATEKGLDQGPEMVRRVEITVEEEWVSGVVALPPARLVTDAAASCCESGGRLAAPARRHRMGSSR